VSESYKSDLRSEEPSWSLFIFLSPGPACSPHTILSDPRSSSYNCRARYITANPMKSILTSTRLLVAPAAPYCRQFRSVYWVISCIPVNARWLVRFGEFMDCLRLPCHNTRNWGMWGRLSLTLWVGWKVWGRNFEKTAVRCDLQPEC
jgi:hypothetical protein